jgi:DNA polymerase-3 subunit epsilon
MEDRTPFVAIDVETANPDMASLCQVGIASYQDAQLVAEWVSHIDPEDYFHPINVSVHGITEETVRGAPTLPAISSTLRERLDDAVVVCHTHFDRVAIQQALKKHGIDPPICTWLDSARVARRAWQEFAWKGYGLDNVCRNLGYEFRHHDALEDAKAAGFILLSAVRETGLSVADWLVRVERPIDPSAPSYKKAIQRDGNPEGALFGEVLVFT